MAGGTDPRAAAMAYWGVISRGATEGLPASEVMELVRDEAARLGHAPGFDTMEHAARLYGQAAALQHAADRLSLADPSSPILAEHLAPLPYGPVLSSPAGVRLFDVRVGFTQVRAGIEETDYVTLRYTGGLPGTVGQLRAEADLIASSLVEGYGRQYVELGDIMIGEL